MTGLQPTARNRLNAAVRADIAARFQADSEQCLAWAESLFGQGWTPAYCHYLVHRREPGRVAQGDCSPRAPTDRRNSQVPGEPLRPYALFFDPGRTAHTRPLRRVGMAPAMSTAKAPTRFQLSRLNRTALGLAVYASSGAVTRTGRKTYPYGQRTPHRPGGEPVCLDPRRDRLAAQGAARTRLGVQGASRALPVGGRGAA